MTTVLITGASRGIGLELVKAAVNRQWKVIACCRDPHTPEKLFEVARMSGGLVDVRILDVTDGAQILALAYELRTVAIDILINNAGRYGSLSCQFGNTDEKEWLENFRVNSIAPVKMAEAFIENIKRGDKRLIATLTSKMASMEDNQSGGSYLYRSSKAAANAAVKSLAVDLKPLKITSVALHPGWVKTDMGGENAEITTRECVKLMLAIIDSLTPADSGRFIDIDGTTIPW